MKPFLTLSILALLTAATVHAQVPQIINYQGQVAVGNARYDGTGKLKFALVNAAGDTTYWSHNGTSAAGAEPTGDGIALTITSGQFSVALGDTAIPGMTQPISPTVFLNNGLYLRVWFSDGQHPFERLAPDLRMASVGYAMTAATVPDGAITAAKLANGAVGTAQLGSNAVSAASIAPGAVGNPQLAADAVRAGNIAAGQVVKSLNGLTDSITLTAGSNVTINPSGNTLQIAAVAGNNGLAGWGLTGNSNTLAGVNFLGTSDKQPLDLKVNGQRALRLEPSTNSAPNVIGGASLNFVAPGVAGATIGGGGATDYWGYWVLSNSVASDFGTIGGGYRNTIEAGSIGSIICGGGNNTVQSDAYGSTIGGGQNNTNSTKAYYSTIPGGYGNTAAGMYSFAAGFGAKANYDGCFVWADSTGVDVVSTRPDQFLIHARGGVSIIGTSLPQAALDVAGDLKVSGAYKGNIGPNGGAPFPRPAYDSGWVEAGEVKETTLTHNIGGNTDNYFVDLQYKNGSGSIGVWDFGGLYLDDDYFFGAYWEDLTSSSIKVKSGYDAVYFRIRIWVYN